jgi:hypothetical protein
MDDAITAIFAPLIGQPCWGADRVHGSILSFEFGSPKLHVREPYVSTSQSPMLRERAARRLVKPVGTWNLFIFDCHWRVNVSSENLADDECAQEQIEVAMRLIDGQKLTEVRLDVAERATTFNFDLGATLTTWPYEANEDEQWSLYLPDGRVLTYRADGFHSLDAGDVKPEEQIWHRN